MRENWYMFQLYNELDIRINLLGYKNILIKSTSCNS